MDEFEHGVADLLIKPHVRGGRMPTLQGRWFGFLGVDNGHRDLRGSAGVWPVARNCGDRKGRKPFGNPER